MPVSTFGYVPEDQSVRADHPWRIFFSEYADYPFIVANVETFEVAAHYLYFESAVDCLNELVADGGS